MVRVFMVSLCVVCGLSVAAAAEPPEVRDAVNAAVRAASGPSQTRFESDPMLQGIYRTWLEEGNFESAETWLTDYEATIRAKQPLMVALYFRVLTQLRLERRDFVGAIASATECLKQKKGPRDILDACSVLRGIARVWTDDYKGAVADTVSFTSGPGSRSALQVASWAYLNLGDLDRAMQAAKRLEDLPNGADNGLKIELQNHKQWFQTFPGRVPYFMDCEYAPRLVQAIHALRTQGLEAGWTIFFPLHKDIYQQLSAPRNNDTAVSVAKKEMGFLTLNNFTAQLYYHLGATYLELGASKEASSNAISALTMSHSDFSDAWRRRMHVLRARANLKRGECGHATESAQWLMEQKDAKGGTAPEAKVGKEVLDACKASGSTPEDPLARIEAAAGRKDHTATIELATAYVALPSLADADKVKALELRAVAYSNKGQFAEALADAESLTSLAPETPLYWSYRGELLDVLKRSEEALPFLAKAAEGFRTAGDSAKAVAALRIITKVHFQAGRPSGCLESIGQLLELQPTNAELYEWRGQALHALGQFGDAIEALSRAIEMNGGNWFSYGLRAKCHEALGDTSAAEADRAKEAELGE